MILPNKVYDVLKWIALIALDAVGVCYKTLALIWGWPFGEEVLSTCAALSVLIGALIGVSTASYYQKGAHEEPAQAYAGRHEFGAPTVPAAAADPAVPVSTPDTESDGWITITTHSER